MFTNVKQFERKGVYFLDEPKPLKAFTSHEFVAVLTLFDGLDI
jgi:hypothetical protein